MLARFRCWILGHDPIVIEWKHARCSRCPQEWRFRG